MSEKLETQKRESTRAMDEFRYKSQQSEENVKELQRQQIQQQSEHEK